MLLRQIPVGPHAVAVSGGADSTALLVILREVRPDVPVHVVHLNHETRGKESDGDAEFVKELAGRLGVPCTIARKSEIESMLEERPRNRSAFYRALRLRLFAQTVRKYHLAGVMLAHHADDQAETVLHRLLRGSSATGLAGMAVESTHRVTGDKLVLRRPLLRTRREELRQFLRDREQSWREDSSNQSLDYFRNKLRKVLANSPGMTESLLELGVACEQWRQWVKGNAPRLEDAFRVSELHDLPTVLAEAAGRRYLVRQGSPAEELTPTVLGRLIEMANDAASAGRQMFPGGILLQRKGRRIAQVCKGKSGC